MTRRLPRQLDHPLSPLVARLYCTTHTVPRAAAFPLCPVANTRNIVGKRYYKKDPISCCHTGFKLNSQTLNLISHSVCLYMDLGHTATSSGASCKLESSRGLGSCLERNSRDRRAPAYSCGKSEHRRLHAVSRNQRGCSLASGSRENEGEKNMIKLKSKKKKKTLKVSPSSRLHPMEATAALIVRTCQH